MDELTKEQRRVWEEWLAERPENVRRVAERFIPFKRYKNRREVDDLGNRYRPISYEEEEDGSVTVTCEKTNDRFPVLAICNVFGMNPDDLIEDE